MTLRVALTGDKMGLEGIISDAEALSIGRNFGRSERDRWHVLSVEWGRPLTEGGLRRRSSAFWGVCAAGEGAFLAAYHGSCLWAVRTSGAATSHLRTRATKPPTGFMGSRSRCTRDG